MNSKAKGSKFERKIASWFTQWTNFKFERNRLGSGAWHSNKDATSDLTCTDEKHAHRCKITIECKNYKEIKFEHVLLGNKVCDIIKFWEQASTDAKRAGKYPILCMRYNSMPSTEFFFVVDSRIGEFISQYVTDKNWMILNIVGKNPLYVFMASSILKVPYKDFHKKVKATLKQ
jgi:hypothetical protein|nr:MAG TPA: holliday junction resolvase [Caudoviricetes sp.]